MTHRKFEHPRHYWLRFFTRKISSHHRKKEKEVEFPEDDQKEPCTLTAFLGYKAGMTHINTYADKPRSSKLYERYETVTIVEVPPMSVVGVVGYVKTPRGLRSLTTVWAQRLSEKANARLYQKWCKSKRKAFTKYTKKLESREIHSRLEALKKYCSVIRVIAHTPIRKTEAGKRKKTHLMEIQVNGGDAAQKVDYAYSLFEMQVPIDDVFHEDEMIDISSMIKRKGHDSHGKEVTQWGLAYLPRKTLSGLKKVACIGAWHPVAAAWRIRNSHRTDFNKKICKVGKAGQDSHIASGLAEEDRTQKAISPSGGFAHPGVVKDDYVLIKGCCAGPKKQVLTLRRSLKKQTLDKPNSEELRMFFETSASLGTCRKRRFNTTELTEGKVRFYGRDMGWMFPGTVNLG